MYVFYVVVVIVGRIVYQNWKSVSGASESSRQLHCYIAGCGKTDGACS